MAHDNLPIRVFLDWCTIFCTRPPRGANCHPILALTSPIQMNTARSPSGRPLLSSRRRVPALSVSLREAILAYRAHHPDHLEEEPAAGPSLTHRRARGKLSVEYSVIRRCKYKSQAKPKVSVKPSSQVYGVKSTVYSCQVYGVKSKVSSLWCPVSWCQVQVVSMVSSQV